MESRQAAWAAVLVAVALVAGAAVLFPGGGERYCHTTGASIGQGVAGPVQYESLSADGKAVIDRYLAGADDDVVVYGGNCPSDFEYGENATTYRVVKDGVAYGIQTSGSGRPAFPAHMLGRWALGIAGAALAVAALSPGVPTPTLVGVLAIALLSAPASLGGNPVYAVWVGLLFLGTAILAGAADGPHPAVVAILSLLVAGGAFAAVDGVPPAGTFRVVPYATAALLAVLIAGVRVVRGRLVDVGHAPTLGEPPD